jgi:hypothetical protein
MGNSNETNKNYHPITEMSMKYIERLFKIMDQTYDGLISEEEFSLYEDYILKINGINNHEDKKKFFQKLFEKLKISKSKEIF